MMRALLVVCVSLALASCSKADYIAAPIGACTQSATGLKKEYVYYTYVGTPPNQIAVPNYAEEHELQLNCSWKEWH